MTPKAVDDMDEEDKKLIEDDVQLLKKELRVKQQQLASFMEKARVVLEANENRGLEEAIHVDEMEQSIREKFLKTLLQYQKEKEVLHLIMIVWWITTIFIGLLSMIIHEHITDYAMYAVWVVLALSNALFILIYKLTDSRKFHRIVVNFRNHHAESFRKKRRVSEDSVYANRNATEISIEDTKSSA